MAQRYTESIFCEAKPRIQDGVIHGVKILGEDSVNGRHYGLGVREKARTKYEGARVNIDHPKKGESVDRSFRDWVGVLENVQVKRDGTFGDLRLRTEHSDYKSIVEAADRFWKDFGLSHVADCESRRIGGVDEVTDIVEVFSVDIVTEPATTNGLTESRNRDMAKPAEKKTVKQVAESLPAEHSVRKLLMEMADGGYDLGSLVVDEPAAPVTDPNQQMLSEMLAAVMETNKMLLAVLAKGKASGGTPPATPPNQETPPVANDPNKPAEQDKEKEEKFAAMESELNRLRAKDLIREHKLDATDILTEAVMGLPEDKRKPFLESIPKASANTRESRRPAVNPPANTANGSEKDPEAIFESTKKRLEEKRQRMAAR